MFKMAEQSDFNDMNLEEQKKIFAGMWSIS